MNSKTNVMIKFISAIVLTLVAYIPTFVWMADRWFAKESYYGHGFLIPLISLFIVWQRKDVLKKVKIAGATSGLWMVIAGLCINIICASLKVYFISGFSFVFVLYGLILFFFGKEMARNLIFPVFFLLAMIPLPLVVIGNLTVRMKLFAAHISTFILNHIGFPSILDGSVIRMPSSYIEIAAPCSGLRSLISLLTLGLLFAYMTKGSYVKKGILLVSSAPIALASNICRIIMLSVVNDLYGEKVAFGFFHDFTGLFVFALAFSGLLGVSKLVEAKTK